MKCFLYGFIFFQSVVLVSAQISLKKIEVYTIEGKTFQIVQRQNHPLKFAQNNIIFELNKAANIEYNLEGYEKIWHNESEMHLIQYTNLDGGTYTLHIKNTAHTEPVLSYSFTIDAPFWKKWWFFPVLIAYIFFVIGAIFYLFFKYRYRQQLKIQLLRNKIANDLHDDVGSTLTSITLLGEKALKRLHAKRAADIEPILEKIISFSQESSESMRGIVMAINPQNDDTVSFIEKLSAYWRDSLAQSEIVCTFDFDDTLPKHTFDLEQRRSIFLMLKEITQNIRKHSKASEARVTIKYLDNQWLISVKDNGIGFVLGQKENGNGLNSIGQRAKDLRADLKISSQPQQGTSIEVRIPTPF